MAAPTMAAAQTVERPASARARGTAHAAQVPRRDATDGAAAAPARLAAATQPTPMTEPTVRPGPETYTRVADPGRVTGEIAPKPPATEPARYAQRRDIAVQEALHTLPVPVPTADRRPSALMETACTSMRKAATVAG